MSAFKVGQRVRNIYMGDGASVPFGAEGVVTGLGEASRPYPDGYQVVFDSHPSWSPDRSWNCRRDVLAPLTDPLAEQFIERIKKIAREPAPLVKEKA